MAPPIQCIGGCGEGVTADPGLSLRAGNAASRLLACSVAGYRMRRQVCRWQHRPFREDE